jgi:glycosyltransferase involved in cell wall biosynthesis
VRAELQASGHQVLLITPEQFRSLPCPTYPEIRLALASARAMAERIEQPAPDAIHIATEGPLGLAARRWCLKHCFPFTTAYHTQFPDYLAKRTHLPAGWFWRYISWFHAPAAAILVATPSIERTLHAKGLTRTKRWGRGVDLTLFHPEAGESPALTGLPRPIQLCVGRVAVEKNVAAFLRAPHPGTKVVVGDGPALGELRARFPAALFLGALHGQALAAVYASADVLVFPSRTDTFGLVMIEALAAGTPVAAYPVPGPIDLLRPQVGCMDPDLGYAIARALDCDRAACAAYGRSFSWAASARQFLAGLVQSEFSLATATSPAKAPIATTPSTIAPIAIGEMPPSFSSSS